jgi:tetratricopeptide (TPR) repeat protein
MPQSDYILRLAEQVGRALAQILYQEQRQDYQGALDFINEQYKQTLGMGAGFIHSAPEETLLAMLTSLGELNAEKCWLLATLLKAEGEIYQLQENENDSYFSFLKALNLYLEVLSVGNSFEHIDQVAEIEGLTHKLADYDLPQHTQEMLFRYFERTGRFSQAEDTLDEMLAAHPGNHGTVVKGIAFYHRLQQKSDTVLRSGNLSRDEVADGLSRLISKA